MNKKKTLVTLLSASTLLALSLTLTNSTVHAADTTEQNSQVNNVNQTTSNIDSNSTNSSNNINQNNDLELRTENALRAANIARSSLTQEQISNLSKINYDTNSKSKTGTIFTYDQYRQVAQNTINRDSRYSVPFFNAKKMKNMPATYTRDAQTGKKAKLDIWDTWVVQDEKTGQVVNYNGYQLAIAMMGIPRKNDSHIYLLYNKYGDNELKNWKTAGPIFGFGASPLDQEWSGSATVNKDGSIQLFYTDVDTREGTNHQKISTVNLGLEIKDGKVRIARRSNRHVIFEGDGYYYQTYSQWKSTNKGADNIAMRDAHVIQVDGKRYLVFEASTGTQNYQGKDQIYNWQNYGGTDAQAIKDFLDITGDEDMTSRASWGNAAIGVISLTDDENNPQLDDVYTPLVTSPMVSDEIERPNVIKLNGKYYLFATTRLNRGTGNDLWLEANKKIGDNVGLLGWVSDDLLSGYKPLNGNADVLNCSVPFNWRTATYSYYPVPVPGRDDLVLVTSYMTNRGYAAGSGKRSTLAPSFLVRINSDDTTEVLDVVTNQGDWIYDETSSNQDLLASNINEARLKGEPDALKDGVLRKLFKKQNKAKKNVKKLTKKQKNKKSVKKVKKPAKRHH